MGTKAAEIVGLDVKEVIEDLRRAYADEWLAAQGYTYMAQIVSGRPAAERVAAALKEIAAEEVEHQDELAERIAFLGGVPPKSFEAIIKSANAPFPETPDDPTDLDGMIKATIEAERGAIEVYQKLAAKCHGKDLLTYELAVHILGEEVEHEDKFESMIS
jgi:bacterioferritin